MKHHFTGKDSLVFAYAKGSPMLAKYLEMNAVTGIQVWRSAGMSGKPAATLMTARDGCGFPEDPSPSLKAARALAYAMAEHTGLPLLDEDEDNGVVIHWSDGTRTTSRNLRGIVAEFNKSIVKLVTVKGTNLRIDFASVRGDVVGFVDTDFADAMVLKGWLCQRRNLRGVACVIDNESGTIPF